MKKIKIVVIVILIGLGVCYIPDFMSDLTIDKIMILAGLLLTSSFVENWYSNNEGIFLTLEIGLNVVGGLGCLNILNLLPITIPEYVKLILMFAATAILAITISDESKNAKK